MGHGAFVGRTGWGLWLPTHYTKDVKWMGHGVLWRGQAGSHFDRIIFVHWVRAFPGPKSGTWGTHCQYNFKRSEPLELEAHTELNAARGRGGGDLAKG